MTPLERLEAALLTLTLMPEETRTVINVGCSRFSTAPLLRRLYPQAKIIGIDPAWWVLRSTPAVWKIAAEGQWLPLARAVAFDLVVIRHPDVYKGRAHWEQICAVLCGRLAHNGILLVSCYTRLEWKICRDLLHTACLTCTDRQMLTIPTKILPLVDLSGQDRFILALRQTPVEEK